MKRNIVFIICLITILCFGSIVSAATTLKDIKDTKYEDSVNTLITLGLVNGYPEDNTYRPDNAVTRAEMAKLLVVALGKEDSVASAQKASARFSDVKSTDWEYGYVNLAAELGIINGYPDGTFGSKNTVSYAEATAMILRALEYEDEVNKSTEVWPNNYINQAKKLSLYSSVGTINSNDGAKRGNIALMLWNMLRTGVCTVVGENSNGLIYGEGEILINKSMAKFVYLENAMISDVDFDDDYELAEVEIKGEKTITVEMDALEATKMYGQKFNILYNKNSKKIELLEMNDDSKIKEGEITKLTSSKIYIDGGASKGYSLPDDDNILLYGIEDLEEAVSAMLVLDGSNLKYVVAFPPEKTYLALVSEIDLKVSDKAGIKVINYKTSSGKSYALVDEDEMPEEGDIILYYLNKDDELVILDRTNVFDSEEVTSVSSTKIKYGENSCKISNSSLEVVKVTESSLKAMSISDIEEDEDSADLIYFAGDTYLIIYVGGVEEAVEKLEDDIEDSVKTLTKYMEKSVIEKTLTKETQYTLATYTKFLNAYNDANTAIENAEKKATVTNLNKLNTAYTDLQSAYSGLKLLSTLSASNKADELEIINAKITLRNIVNGTTLVDEKKVPTCVTNKSSYTSASYSKFETALKNANDALRDTSVTLNRIENTKEDLIDATKGLLTNADNKERDAALTRLKEVLKTAEEKAKNQKDYTENSYKNFLSRWNEAKAIKDSEAATKSEIETATSNLNNAITLLSKSLEEVSDDLNKLLLEAQEKLAKTNTYMPETFNDLKTAYNNAKASASKANVTESELKDVKTKLNKAISGLVNVNEKLKELKTKASTYKLEKIKTLANGSESTFDDKVKKILALDKAMKDEDEDKKFYFERLTRYINDASKIKKADWSTSRYSGTFENMQKALEAAKTVKNKKDATSEELKTASNNLEKSLALKN